MAYLGESLGGHYPAIYSEGLCIYLAKLLSRNVGGYFACVVFDVSLLAASGQT